MWTVLSCTNRHRSGSSTPVSASSTRLAVPWAATTRWVAAQLPMPPFSRNRMSHETKALWVSRLFAKVARRHRDHGRWPADARMPDRRFTYPDEMTIPPEITVLSPEGKSPDQGQVAGREEPGWIIESGSLGKGSNVSMPAYLLYFESTGECVWFAKSKVTRI
jgi:hypothetical protein